MVLDPKVLIALDFNSTESALNFVAQLTPNSCRLKVGKELFAIGGPQFVKSLIAQGYDVFLDLKYHDIPNTVAKACQAAAQMGVWMVNVHALGGSKMMRAAKEALAEFENPPILIAVTILTSMSEDDLQEIGLRGSPEENVLRLATLAKNSGLAGVVCSAQEASILKKELGSDFCLVTPGIRPEGSASHDQQRIMTPAAAINAGAHYLVVGRPITQAENPASVLQAINHSI